MAVYKRGYQRYDGPLTSRTARLMAFPHYAWRRLLGQRLVIVALMLSLIWPLACAVFIYLANHSELWRGLGAGDLGRLLEINETFFLYFINGQLLFTVIVAALAGPGLIAPDLANGGLPLYLSRPLTRTEYIGARLIVLAGLLSLFTWIPGLLLFAMQSGIAGWDWAVSHWRIAGGLLAASASWILFVSLVALAGSAWVKWRIVAGAVVLAFFFLTAGSAELINAVFREQWGSYLNPGMLISCLCRGFFDLDQPRGMTAPASAASLAAMTAVLAGALFRKLRPVEVVR